jgi:hypothetical protein
MRPVEMEVPEPPAHLPGRRKTSRKKWCKGRVGVEHQTELGIDTRRAWAYKTGRPDLERCKPFGDTKGWFKCKWKCLHVLRCKVCGKIVEHYVECPDMPAEYSRWP